MALEQASGPTTNVCLEYCKGACCMNIIIPRVSSSDVVKFTPPGTKVYEMPPAADLDTVVSQVPDQTVVVQRSAYGLNEATVYLSGACPNLTDGKCAIYEERPEPCRQLEAGSTRCNLIRVMQGLRDLPVIPLREI